MTEETDISAFTEKVFYLTQDPQTPSPFGDGKPMPAGTTLLHRVCGNDTTKFAEALRLIDLFVEQARAMALEEAKANAGKPIAEAPRDGTPLIVISIKTENMRYKPYLKGSPQQRRGIRGRWQVLNDYGGWMNCNEPDDAAVFRVHPQHEEARKAATEVPE